MVRFKFVYTLWMALMLFQYLPIIGATPLLDQKQTEIDSLLKILPLSPKSEKIEILFSLSQLYMSFSMDISREYAKRALQNAKEINRIESIAEAYKLLGNISYYKGEYNEVVGYYDSSLMQYGLTNDSFGQAKVLNNLGIIFQHVGDYHKSIDYQLKSLEFKIKLGDSAGIANSYNNIGSIYYDLKDYQKSAHYFKMALKMSEKLRLKNSIQGILNNLGIIEQDMGNLQSAEEFFKKSIESGQQSDDLIKVATAYHNLGKTMFLKKAYSRSLEYYNKALEIYDQLDIKNSQTLNNIGQVYLDLDYYKKAIYYLNLALQDAQQNNQFNVLVEVYKNLSVAYERMGDFKKAYFNFLEYNTFQDSLASQVYSSKIEDLITKNEIDKSRDQLEKAQLKIEKTEAEVRRRNFAIYSVVAGLIAVLVFAIIILRLLRLKSNANLLLKQQNDEILRSQKTIKKINKALTESEATLRSIFDVSPFSILVIDKEGRINDCNDTSLKMFKVKNKRNLLDKNIENFVQSRVDNGPAEILPEVKANRLTKSQFVIKRIDLTSFNAELTGRLIHDNTSDGGSYIIVVSDVTERMKFIENLKAAKLKAEESDTLKTAFLTNMSHEIRTPMNSIIGFSNLLMDSNLIVEKRNEYLSHILQSSSLLLNLIDDIIDISKIEAEQLNFNPEVFMLNEVVSLRYNEFSEVNKSNDLEFRLNLPENSEDIACKTDLQRLRQVMGNLLSNAVKFTKKGFIELGYELDQSGDEVIAKFFVKDSGIGIKPEMHEIIFERFRQVDDSRTRSFGGTGLGLAICKKLVDLMNGRIWVESEYGEGSTFYFTLPVFKLDRKLEATKRVNGKKKYDWQSKSLLIAEDENSNYELMKATLQSTGIKLIRAVNGEEAVEMVQNNAAIDLVLMDIRMPKINGYDATRQIKSIRKDLPVLATTAYAMTEDEDKSLKAGCDMYISKPISPIKLLEILSDYLEDA